MMANGFNMGFGGGFMGLFWILLLVVVAWLLFSAFSGRQAPPGGTRTALEILEERYARGEIGQDEYRQKKGDLTN